MLRLASIAVIAGVIAISSTQPAVSQDVQSYVPARVLCENGRVVQLQIALSEPGLITLQIPPDVCAKPQQPPASKPRPQASSARTA